MFVWLQFMAEMHNENGNMPYMIGADFATNDA